MTIDQTGQAAEPLLTPAEAAACFGVTPKALRTWAAAGLLSVQRTLRGHHRYSETEVRTLAARLRTEAKAA